MHVLGKDNQLQYIIIYYVNEHQLPPIIDASHTTPITRVKRGPKLLKLIGWRHCSCFRCVLYIPGTTAQTLVAELVLSLGSQEHYNRNKNRTGYKSPPGNPAVEPSFGCTTYILGPPKIQTLSSPLISPNFSVSYLISCH